MSEQNLPLWQQQINYYRARANEYDEWFLRQGRYDQGETDNQQWFTEVETVRAALTDFAPTGNVLEFAGGTGLWTEQLAQHATQITVVDASPEMLQLNQARLAGANVRYQQADIFTWQPRQQYDVVFFSFWLSHVPSEQFAPFWQLVKSCLGPNGRIFFIDSRHTPKSTANDHHLPEPEATTLTRILNDGRQFDIVKIFYKPPQLMAELQQLGWTVDVQTTNTYFIYGQGHLT